MQIWLDVFAPPPLKFHRCNLLCYTCVKWYFRSMQIWLDVFDTHPPAKILWMHFVTLHHSHSTNQHPAAPDTTKTTCYRSAAQCWKAFLVRAYCQCGNYILIEVGSVHCDLAEFFLFWYKKIYHSIIFWITWQNWKIIASLFHSKIPKKIQIPARGTKGRLAILDY